MHRMGTASVLIAGMGGLGVEIAKNVILSGVKSVTVQDEGQSGWADLSSQVLLRVCQLQRNRILFEIILKTYFKKHIYIYIYFSMLSGCCNSKTQKWEWSTSLWSTCQHLPHPWSLNPLLMLPNARWCKQNAYLIKSLLKATYTQQAHVA